MFIDSTTFWITVIIIGLGIAISYYLLSSRLKATEAVLTKLASAIDKDLGELKNENLRAQAKIYQDMANAIDEISVNQKKEKTKPKK